MQKKNSGFTLLELMVTIAILAIVAALAGPSFSDLLARNRGAAQVNALVAGLNAARAEAVKRAQAVQFCTSGDGVNCGGSAASPWIVALANDPDNLNPLRVIEPMDLVNAGDGAREFAFQINGALDSASSDTQIRLGDSKRNWTIAVSPSGGISSTCSLVDGGGKCI